MYLAIRQIGRELFAAHLIEDIERVLHHADRIGCTYRTIHRAVDDIHDHTVRRDLLVVVPADRSRIEVDRRVRTQIDHRVTYHLHVVPVYPRFVVRTYAAISAVRQGGVRKMQLFREQRVGVYIRYMQTVGPVHHQRTVGRITAAVFLVHLPVLAVERRPLCRVAHLHVSQHLAETDLLVVVDRVAGHRLAVVMLHQRTVQQHRLLAVRVIPPARSGDRRLFFIDDRRRTDDIRHFRVRLVDQRVARQHEVGIGQVYFLTEQRLLGVRHILPAHGSEGVERVLNRAAGVVIRYASRSVVVHTVGRHHGGILILSAVNEPHVSAHTRELRVAVIE